jgi:hypothetical protein
MRTPMRNALITMAAFLAATSGCTATYSSSGSSEIPRRPPGATYPNWEYFCSADTIYSFADRLKEAGQEGWEMVSAGNLTCFKRPVQAAAGPTPQAQVQSAAGQAAK